MLLCQLDAKTTVVDKVSHDFIEDCRVIGDNSLDVDVVCYANDSIDDFFKCLVDYSDYLESYEVKNEKIWSEEVKVDTKGLKFKYLAFDKMVEDFKGVAIWIDGKEIASGDFSEVTDKLSEYSDIQEYQVIETRSYFDIFVIELKSI